MSGHGGGSDDDPGAMAWPGFVDVLSSVLIMFVFFLMITAVALYFHTVLFKGKIQAQNQKIITEEVTEQTQTNLNQLTQENIELKKQIEQMQKVETVEAQRELETKLKMLQQAPLMAESKDQKITIEGPDSVLVFYGADSISMTEDSVKQVREFLSKFPPDTIRVTIQATRDTSNRLESTARRVAVARMLNLRNVVLQYEVPREAIAASVIEGAKIGDNYDWVRMKVEAK